MIQRVFLWFYCAFPPNLKRSLGVVDFEKDEVYHFPEAVFSEATPLVDNITGDVYYCNDKAIFKCSPNPDDKPEMLCLLPETIFKNVAKIERPATHLTFSPDRTKMFLDRVTCCL